MFTTLIVFQVMIAIGLIAIVLVQRGPGATMGAAFGAGASGTVFGSRGAGNFLTRTTGWLAVGFFMISLGLAVLATTVSRQDTESSLMGSVVEPAAEQSQEVDPASTIDAVIDSIDQQSGEAVDDGIAETGEEIPTRAAGSTETEASDDESPAAESDPADEDGTSGSGG